MTDQDTLLLTYVQLNFDKWKYLFGFDENYPKSYTLKGKMTTGSMDDMPEIPVNVLNGLSNHGENVLFQIYIWVLTEDNKRELLRFVTEKIIPQCCLVVTSNTELKVFEVNRLDDAGVKCLQVALPAYSIWYEEQTRKGKFHHVLD
jgi:hypothetical protein